VIATTKLWLAVSHRPAGELGRLHPGPHADNPTQANANIEPRMLIKLSQIAASNHRLHNNFADASKL